MIEKHVSTWHQALLLPGETDLVESGIRELAEYFGISLPEARHACESSLEDSKREWDVAERRTPEQVVAFYRHTRSYLFEHIWWHATDVETNSSNAAILDYATARGAGEYLDFGSGVGSNAILFAKHGYHVVLADVSLTMLDFARWRLERRGIKAEYIDLNLQPLPRGRFDLVTAVDVCEHLVDPGAELKRLGRALAPRGALIFNYRAGIDEDRPMHILATATPVLRSIRRNGLREAGGDADPLRRLGFSVVEHGSQSRFKNTFYGALDYARYNWLFLPSEASGTGLGRDRISHPQQIFFERVKNSLSSSRSSPRWLDIGCGLELVPWWLKDRASLETELRSRARSLVGVDLNFEALRENRSCNIRLNVDAAHLPFADESFDLVTCNMVFEHLADPRLVLGEIRRVLRPGGRLIAITANWLDFMTIAARSLPGGLREKFAPRTESQARGNGASPHFRLNRLGTIDSLLKIVGFTQRRIEKLDQPDTYAHIPVLARIESVWHQMARRWPALRGALLIEAGEAHADRRIDRNT